MHLASGVSSIAPILFLIVVLSLDSGMVKVSGAPVDDGHSVSAQHGWPVLARIWRCARWSIYTLVPSETKVESDIIALLLEGYAVRHRMDKAAGDGHISEGSSSSYSTSSVQTSLDVVDGSQGVSQLGHSFPAESLQMRRKRQSGEFQKNSKD